MAADKLQTQLVSFRLREDDIQRLNALVAAGYAENRTAALRRALEETAKWELPRAGLTGATPRV